jgi:hypothetical protein
VKNLDKLIGESDVAERHMKTLGNEKKGTVSQEFKMDMPGYTRGSSLLQPSPTRDRVQVYNKKGHKQSPGKKVLEFKSIQPSSFVFPNPGKTNFPKKFGKDQDKETIKITETN